MQLGDCDLTDGCYPLEQDGEGPFVWTRQTFALEPRAAAAGVRVHLCYLGASGRLLVTAPGGAQAQVELCYGWLQYVFAWPEAGAGPFICRVEPLVPAEQDSRELGVMLRTFELIDDPRHVAELARRTANALLNDREFRSGRPVLASYPTGLRITMETRCNIPETGQACVYCAWDWAKRLERGSPVFRAETLDELGGFYGCATEVVDCSYGEPTMNKHFPEILARIDADGKRLSLTTNGQLLVERRRRDLLGKNVDLYVSIDSATAAGYTRYRNDRFDDIITNLRALCREKRQHQNLPSVFVSFIAMRSSIAELPQLFPLLADVGVDEVKLRALFLDDNTNAPVIVNNGYRFDYAAEVLSLAERRALSPVARRLAEMHRVKLYIEWDEFEREEAGDRGAPPCAEPWKTMYAMRRGVMPCCYATEPLARWDEQGDRPLEVFLQDVFNGPAYQQLRSELAAGRLAEYCQRTPSCPVLQRMNSHPQAAGRVEERPAAAGPSLPLVPVESLTVPAAASTAPA